MSKISAAQTCGSLAGRRRLVLLAVCAALATAHAQPAMDQTDLAGTYAVTGTNMDGSPYEGRLSIVRRGAVYQFSWATGNTFEGVGIPLGDVVAVGFGGASCGVAAYQRGADGVLDGVWALYGAEATGTERVTGAEGVVAGFGGGYAVAGTNPDGSAYSGSLTIEGTADTYGLAWETGSGPAVGVGLGADDTLAAGFGGEGCGVVAYRVGPGGALEGTWTSYGAGAAGTERAVRQ